MLAGVLLGNLPSFLIFIRLAAMRGTLDPDHLTGGWYGLARAILLGTSVGTISAATFWLLAGSALGRTSASMRREIRAPHPR